MKPPKDHIPFLDYLRGIAILAVFLFHCLEPNPLPGKSIELSWNGWFRDFNVQHSFYPVLPLTIGWIGVAIFFVVSGFCIHLSHEKSREKDFGIFFIRRFFRIYPPYLAALLIFALIFPWSKLDFSSTIIHVHTERLYSLISLGAHIALVHNFSELFSWDINGAFWSIAVEVQLYLLYPLVLVMASRLGWGRTLAITAVIEFALRAFVAATGFPNAIIFLNPLYFWFSWSLGAYLAEAYLKGKPLPFTGRSLLLFPSLFLVCYMVKPLSYFCFPLGALSTVYLMSHWLSHPETVPTGEGRGGFIFRHLRFVGLISYSLYLIHQPLINAVPDVIALIVPGAHIPYLGMFSICVASWIVILVPTYLFYRFVELPSIALGKRFIDKRRKALSPPVAAFSSPTKPEPSVPAQH